MSNCTSVRAVAVAGPTKQSINHPSLSVFNTRPCTVVWPRTPRIYLRASMTLLLCLREMVADELNCFNRIA